jgi:hypothetical protein
LCARWNVMKIKFLRLMIRYKHKLETYIVNKSIIIINNQLIYVSIPIDIWYMLSSMLVILNLGGLHHIPSMALWIQFFMGGCRCFWFHLFVGFQIDLLRTGGLGLFFFFLIKFFFLVLLFCNGKVINTVRILGSNGRITIAMEMHVQFQNLKSLWKLCSIFARDRSLPVADLYRGWAEVGHGPSPPQIFFFFFFYVEY